VGGLRTALYNFLYARHNNGSFILRIEDTDRSRYVEGAVENLIETLRWAGLEFDEGPGKGGPAGPYIQSERLTLYREHAQKLLESGKAYYAFDTPEELEEMRKQQEGTGLPVKHERRMARLSPEQVRQNLDSGVPAVIRMRVPDNETIAFDDVVRGRVEFSSEQLDNQVLIKSDGYPTYHLANVVDDHSMGITHVIRGEEWLSSTPKHVLLYTSFGWECPTFAHLPLLLNPDRSKLSKRQGDVAVEDYRRKGYLPEALVNFVALLGWNPGDEREIFSLQQLVEEFSLERVGKSGAVFNLEKLSWMNTTHLRSRSDEELARLVRPSIEAAGFPAQPAEYLQSVVRLMRERIEMPDDLPRQGGYFFRDPDSYDQQSRKKNWKPETPAQLSAVREGLEGLGTFDHGSVESTIRGAGERLGVGASKLIHPLRLALTGVSAGPGLFELITLLGKETCVRRIDRAISLLG
jgi:glutamyl-tRNA synthetase